MRCQSIAGLTPALNSLVPRNVPGLGVTCTARSGVMYTIHEATVPSPMLLETKQKLKVRCDSTALQKQDQQFLYVLPVLYQSEKESVKTEA